MKMNEVTVSDWVYLGTQRSNMGGDYDVFFKAQKLTLDDLKFWADNDWDDWVFDEFIKPIPLTEEFFEKNGFVLNNSFYPLYKKYENEDKRIMITDEANSGDGYWYVHVDNEDYDTIGGCDVKYVHQFQQLLRLCGYEMDVVV